MTFATSHVPYIGTHSPFWSEGQAGLSNTINLILWLISECGQNILYPTWSHDKHSPIWWQ